MQDNNYEIEIYKEYEKRKKELIKKCKTFEQYEIKLKQLIDELRI